MRTFYEKTSDAIAKVVSRRTGEYNEYTWSVCGLAALDDNRVPGDAVSLHFTAWWDRVFEFLVFETHLICPCDGFRDSDLGGSVPAVLESLDVERVTNPSRAIDRVVELYTARRGLLVDWASRTILATSGLVATVQRERARAV